MKHRIWLLAENLLPGDVHAREYRLQDRQGRMLADLGGIHLLELKKFTAERVETEEQRWLKFFKDGGQLDDVALPDWMDTREMRQAMSTLKLFSEKERDYHAYQALQNYLREQRTIQKEMEEMRQEKEAIQKEKELAQQERELALQEKDAIQQALEQERGERQSMEAELERLKALLAQAGQRNP